MLKGFQKLPQESIKALLLRCALLQSVVWNTTQVFLLSMKFHQKVSFISLESHQTIDAAKTIYVISFLLCTHATVFFLGAEATLKKRLRPPPNS